MEHVESLTLMSPGWALPAGTAWGPPAWFDLSFALPAPFSRTFRFLLLSTRYVVVVNLDISQGRFKLATVA
jgi:hypothetical protein